MYGSTGGNKNGPNVNDPEEWLMVFDDCTERVQLMQEAIAKRNERLAKDSKSANDNKMVELNAKLKKDLRLLGRDLQDMNSALSNQSNQITSREIGRRRDQLNDLMQRKDELTKLFNKKVSSANSAGRKNLLGDDSRGSGKKQTKFKPDEEPEAIKGFDHQQILTYQENVMEDQDKGLDILSEALNRTRHIGLAISDELDEHKVLLEDMEHDVERTDFRIKKETRRMDVLLKSSKTPIALCIIVVLFLIIVALIVVVLKFSNVF